MRNITVEVGEMKKTEYNLKSQHIFVTLVNSW